jgi:hypothetical protein
VVGVRGLGAGGFDDGGETGLEERIEGLGRFCGVAGEAKDSGASSWMDLFQKGKECVAYPIPREAWGEVRRILARLEGMGVRVLLELGASEGKEGAEDSRGPLLRNSRQPLDSGPPKDAEEDGLHLVVRVMRGEHSVRRAMSDEAFEEVVAQRAGRGLVARRMARAFQMEANSPALGECAQPGGIRLAFRAHPVIEVGGLHDEAKPVQAEAEEVEKDE